MTTRARRYVTPLLWLLMLVLIARFVWQTFGVMTRYSDGFAAYYTSARLMRAGDAGPRIYDDAWFGGEVARLVPGVKDIYNANPPTTSLLLLPLSWARYETARTIWILLTVAILAATLFFILRETALSGPPALIFVCVALASQPLEANMRQGQVYVHLLALATLVWIGFRRSGDRLAGIPLGAMLALKTAGSLLPLLFLIRRRWRALAWTVSTGLVMTVASFIWFGLNTWKTYLHALAGLRDESDLSVTAYQTTTSLFGHLFVFDASWNPAPLVDVPMVGAMATLTLSLVLLGSTLAIATRSDDLDLSFAGMLTLTILLSPVSLDYHYTVLLLPFAIVLARAWKLDDLRLWAVLAAGAILVMADLPYTSPRVANNAWALLGYPKLAGGLLIWALTMWLMRRTATQPVISRGRLAMAAEPAPRFDSEATG